MSAEELVVSSKSVIIAAPAEFVWEILVDYAAYPEWNPYTVEVTTSFVLGEPIDLVLPHPDGRPGTFVNREFLRIIDAPRHLRYDTGDEAPGLRGSRDQYIDPLDASWCTYRTTDTFTGENAARAVRYMGAWVQQGFDSVADALKTRAEELWTASAQAPKA